MKTTFTKRPLCLFLGLAMLSVAAVPSHAQLSRTTDKSGVRTSLTESGTIDGRAGATLARLTPALAAFWASTEPSKSYMIFDTMVRRGIDGRVTWAEGTKAYVFGPTTSPKELLDNAPSFVSLLLGQYATQERMALAELESALVDYFASTRPGQGTSKPGGQLMRNSDGSATFTDGKIIFVFDESTTAATVATMAPALAAALTALSGAIVPGPVTGYALRDPSNANQLINYDGRMYDTAGNALGNANPATVAALFGKGNGSAATNGGGNGSNGGASSGGSSGSGSSSGGGSGSNSSGGSNGSNSGSGDSNSGSGSSNGSNGSSNNSSGAWGGGSGSGSGGSSNSNGSGASNGSDSGGGWGSNTGSGSGGGSNSGSGSNSNANGGGSSNGTGPGTNSNGGAGSNNGSNGSGVNNGIGSNTNNGSGTGVNGGTGTGNSGTGNTTGSSTGTGLYGNVNLTTGSSTGVSNATYGVSAPVATPPAGANCTMVRSLNGGGGFSCN